MRVASKPHPPSESTPAGGRQAEGQCTETFGESAWPARLLVKPFIYIRLRRTRLVSEVALRAPRVSTGRSRMPRRSQAETFRRTRVAGQGNGSASHFGTHVDSQ